MDEENEIKESVSDEQNRGDETVNNTQQNSSFNISPNQKKTNFKPKKESKFGKTILVPFVAGVLGASLMIGVCFGIPSVRKRIIPSGSSLLNTGTSGNPTYVNVSDYSNIATTVAEKSLPSVVGIKVSYQISSFFGSSKGEATGSGIIITEDGYILTNNHVVASTSNSYFAIQEATGITVKLYGDETEYPATVVGTDSYTDLAVIKIEKDGLTPATLGNSDDVKIGEFVMAVGNPLGMDYSVTAGIVSAVNREIETDGATYYAIQTDAAINSGNSGGALVNANGEVIGVNTLKFAGNGVEGVGFAIPISQTTKIVEQLMTNSEVIRPYIGITGSSVDSQVSEKYNIPKGVYVESVQEGSPAEKAGIQKGDIVTQIEGKDVASISELNRYKYNYEIGDKVTLTVIRNQEEMKVEVTLGNPPEEKEEPKTQTQTIQVPSSSGSGSIFDFFNY